MKKTATLSLVLTLICCMSAVSCGGGKINFDNPVEGKDYKISKKTEAGEVYSWTYKDFGEGVMPIAGFIGPTSEYPYEGNLLPNRITDESYATIKDCGLNIIYGHKEDWRYAQEDIISSLTYAEKYGIKYLFYDTSVIDISRQGLVASTEDIRTAVSKYSGYKAFGGLLGMDEPYEDKFDKIAEAQTNFRAATADLDVMLYANLFPVMVLGSRYETYLSDFMKTNPVSLSYDMYPFEGKGTEVHTSHFTNLELARKVAAENKKPFWVYIQGGGGWENCNYRIPSEGELLWQVNTSLCYGAKGIQHFPYYQPPEYAQIPEEGAGLINMDGKKNQTWYFAQKANRQIAAIDEVLMSSVNEGVIVHGGTPAPITGTAVLQDYRQLKKVGGDDALIGCFNYEGASAYYVVNNSITKEKAEITLTFDDSYMYDVTQRAVRRSTLGKTFTLKLAAGEGALVVLR